MKKEAKYLASKIFLLNVLDAFGTAVAVKEELVVELNPIMDYFLQHSTWGFLIFKLGLIYLLLLYTLSRLENPKVSKKLTLFCFKGLVFIYTLVVLSNTISITLGLYNVYGWEDFISSVF